MTEQFHHQLVFGSLHCFETKMNKVEMKDLISDVLIFPASFHFDNPTRTDVFPPRCRERSDALVVDLTVLS